MKEKCDFGIETAMSAPAHRNRSIAVAAKSRADCDGEEIRGRRVSVRPGDNRCRAIRKRRVGTRSGNET